MIETIKKISKNVGKDFIIILKKLIVEKVLMIVLLKKILLVIVNQLKTGVDMLLISSGDYHEVNTKEYKGKSYYLEKTIKASENVKIPVILIGGIRDYDSMINVLKDSKN